MPTRILSRPLGLLLVIVALAFSGCAMNDGYSPISSGSSVAPGGYAPQGSGFRSS